MNFRTTCSRCRTVFRIDTDQLDAAAGWAQCSVCGAAFNARASLLMEDGSPVPVAPPPVPSSQAAAEEAEGASASLTADETPTSSSESHAVETANPSEEPALSPAASLAPTTGARGIAEREADLDLPSIILIDPDGPAADEPGPLPEIYGAPLSYERETPAPFAPIPATVAAPRTRIEYASPAKGGMRPSPSPRRSRGWVWGGAVALLLLLLLGQLAYFMRDAVVTRLPQTRPAYTQLCALLGCTLSLPKNLAQLQILGSDLETEASGRLKLTLTLGNRAAHAQAWPVLVLTLTDQLNRPLARRSFAPSEYLGDPRRIREGVPARSEQALSLPLTVRNLAPLGFDLQLSY